MSTERTINEFYPLILKKLEAIELLLNNKEVEIKSYLETNPETLKSADVLLAGLKSTRTSFELLRDEIEELHELTIVLSKEGRVGGE